MMGVSQMSEILFEGVWIPEVSRKRPDRLDIQRTILIIMTLMIRVCKDLVSAYDCQRRELRRRPTILRSKSSQRIGASAIAGAVD
jgi:hypothetical protein